MSENHGGTAFGNGHGGMSLRDYFAAKALGLIENAQDVNAVAKYCYALADAMLAARKP